MEKLETGEKLMSEKGDMDFLPIFACEAISTIKAYQTIKKRFKS